MKAPSYAGLVVPCAVLFLTRLAMDSKRAESGASMPDSLQSPAEVLFSSRKISFMLRVDLPPTS